MLNKSIPLSEPLIGKAEKDKVLACLDSGFVSSTGPMVAEFEEQFARRTGSKHAIATASGTAALHLALMALGVKKGQSVAVPDLTFVASMNPVIYCGANPELIDVGVNSWCMDVGLLEETCKFLAKRGRLPAAVIPVHLYGCSCDMNGIVRVARRFGMKVVEDATEALGTTYEGRFTGTIGDAGCFSFNGNKTITTGCGGMVVTGSEELAHRIRYLANQARDSAERYFHSEMGFNYRISNIAAALGLAQLERLDNILEAKKNIAARYRNAFNNINEISCHPEFTGISNSYWLYSVTVADRELRDSIIRSLSMRNIQARGFFHPLHRQPYALRKLWIRKGNRVCRGNTGNSDILSETGINLPSSASLSRENQQKVIDAFLEEALRRKNERISPLPREIPTMKKAS